MHSVLNNLQAKVNALPALCYSGRLRSLEGDASQNNFAERRA